MTPIWVTVVLFVLHVNIFSMMIIRFPPFSFYHTIIRGWFLLHLISRTFRARPSEILFQSYLIVARDTLSDCLYDLFLLDTSVLELRLSKPVVQVFCLGYSMKGIYRNIVTELAGIRVARGDYEVMQKSLELIGCISGCSCRYEAVLPPASFQAQLDNRSTAKIFVTVLSDHPGDNLPVI